MPILKYVEAGELQIAYEESGDLKGTTVILLHGFPYDIRTYDKVRDLLISSNCRTIIPYLRGYGSTKFLSENTFRSGQQAALAYDLISLMDALSLSKVIVAGYDWGGRAACIVAALYPERIIGLVSGGGYNIQNIPESIRPQKPELEMLDWYQYYFHCERGRAGLTKYRKEFGGLLWKLWSPTWNFDETTYSQTAVSFDNPDFVDIVIHSYRHRYGLETGSPVFEKMEQELAAQPKISIPTIVLDGESDGVSPLVLQDQYFSYFTGRYERKIVRNTGHNLPQESPEVFASAVLSLVHH